MVNAQPRESVDLFNLARAGKSEEAFQLYRWFLPLLRMDTVRKFVQLIKQVEEEPVLARRASALHVWRWWTRNWPPRKPSTRTPRQTARPSLRPARHSVCNDSVFME